MLAAIGLDVTTARLVPKLLMVTDVTLPRVAPTLMANVPQSLAVQGEHAPTERQITIKEVKATNKVVQEELVMVVDAVSNDVVMLVEEATTEATMNEDVSTPVKPTALMTGSLVVFVVLQDSVLIKGI